MFDTDAGILTSSFMPITASARMILPTETFGAIHMWITMDGMLHWDKVEDADGYEIRICEHPGTISLIDLLTEAGTLSVDLYGALDEGTYDNGEVLTLPGQVMVNSDEVYRKTVGGKLPFVEILEQIKLNLSTAGADGQFPCKQKRRKRQ